ncbi:MAG: hypothetical protein ABFQ82_04010 [Thermodesulfobacteriota bacterium]
MGMASKENSVDLSVVMERLDFLESRVEEIAGKLALTTDNTRRGARANEEYAQPDPFLKVDSSEGISEWVSKGGLLQKLASVCFIMVFALLLRTVTDYGYINVTAGSMLGLAYAVGLGGAGCFFYSREKMLATVFSVCGFLLYYSIIVEGYSRFGAISAVTAYAALFLSLGFSAFVGLRYQAGKLLAFSLIGLTVSALVLGYPQLNFPMSGFLILAANAVLMVAIERRLVDKLKWPVTIITMLFWALWAFKGHMPLQRGEVLPEYIGIGWLLPLLSCYGLFYFTVYLRRYFGSAELGVFDAILPSLNMILIFIAANVVVNGLWHKGWLHGFVTLVIGLLHVGVGWKLSTRDAGRAGGVGGAVVAGALMLAMALPAVVGNIALAIPFWSVTAYGLLRLSGRCNSGMIRIISYLYQLFVLWIGMMAGVFGLSKLVAPEASLLAAASLALMALLQFGWARKNPMPEGALVTKLDSHDYAAIPLLLAGVAGVYFFASLLVDIFAVRLLEIPVNTIYCGRSVLLRLGAIALLLIGSRNRKLELVWVAVAVGLIACLKVFLVDLFNTSGIPLVLSVLSFGILAAVGSVVMGRWNRLAAGG